MLPDMIGKPLRQFAATGVGARFYRAVLPPTDRVVRKLSGGKHTFTELVLPTFMITTIGRKSGEPREQPLVYLEVGAAFAVAGSNWGQTKHPAWAHNLVANPDATVDLKGVSFPVTARLLEGAEAERVYARFEGLSPNYAKYKQTCGDRVIRVFLLERG